MHIDRPITIALILFVILLLVFFLVMPEYQTFKSLRLELGQKQAEFNAEYDYFSAITQTYYDIQSRADDIAKIDDALPSDPNLGKLVYFLQDQAQGNGLILKDLFLSKSSPSNVPGSIGVNDEVFSLDLLGDYPALENFIKSLEDSDRLFEITSISFGATSVQSSPAQSNSQNTLQPQTQFQSQQTYSFNLEIKTHSYSSPNQQAVGSE